jgi:transposase
MTEQTKTRIPAPLYAAAGAGDLAYQQLRKLPAVINELSDRATASLKTVNQTANSGVDTLRERATTTDLEQLRNTAASSAAAFAQLAQERAIAIYTGLVARGERVVGTGVVASADAVNADMATTTEPQAVEAAQPKPRKRARPAGQ